MGPFGAQPAAIGITACAKGFIIINVTAYPHSDVRPVPCAGNRAIRVAKVAGTQAVHFVIGGACSVQIYTMGTCFYDAVVSQDAGLPLVARRLVPDGHDDRPMLDFSGLPMNMSTGALRHLDAVCVRSCCAVAWRMPIKLVEIACSDSNVSPVTSRFSEAHPTRG